MANCFLPIHTHINNKFIIYGWREYWKDISKYMYINVNINSPCAKGDIVDLDYSISYSLGYKAHTYSSFVS